MKKPCPGVQLAIRAVRKWGRREGVGFKSYVSKDATDIITAIRKESKREKRL